MARETKQICARYDVAVVEVARLASLGYAIRPLSLKLVGLVLYATMEINTEQLVDVEQPAKVEQPVGTSVVDETQNGDVSPVTASVSVKTPKTTRTKASKDA